MKQTTRDYTKVLVQIQFIYSPNILVQKEHIYIYRMNIDTNRQRYIHIYTGKR